MYELPKISAPPLSLVAVVERRVRPDNHAPGAAVRITDKNRAILLIVATEEELGALLSALHLRVAL